jgi:hypothetical protein
MNRNLCKKGMVLGIIILLSATPAILVANAGEDDTYLTLKANVYDGNYLGYVTAVHHSIEEVISDFQSFCDINVVQPETKNFYFEEDEGEVLMNFTLNVSHRLNAAERWYAKRYTHIETWISDTENNTDYFHVPDNKLCELERWDHYKIYLTEEDQIEPLETDGKTKNLTVMIKVTVGLTSFFRIRRGQVEMFEITIHPT